MNPFQRRFLWSTTLLTGVTGLIYWWMENRMEPLDPWAAINHPLQPWILKAHILVAPLMVFAVGLVTANHIWKHYRSDARAGRRSGLTAMVLFLPMVISGYLIQAVTHTGWLEALAWTHLVTGVIYLGGMGLHARFVRGFLANRVRNGMRMPKAVRKQAGEASA